MPVLVADDSAVQRELLTHMLKNHGREVATTGDGERAWQILQNNDSINLVFTDWTMPGLTGPELIRKIRTNLRDRYVYVILCTSRSSKTDLIEGMRSGADDFVVKPVEEDELLARLASGERIIELETRLERDKGKLEEANAALLQAYATMRNDLDAAARMQRSLLPGASSFQGIRFDSLFAPASVLAGDIFNFFPLSDHAIGFYVLDVSGHGIPAAMLSVTLSKVLVSGPLASTPLKRAIPRAPGYEIVPPNTVIGELNRRFQADDGMYFTMVYGVVDTKARRLTLSQAGHPHPIYLQKGTSGVALGEGGFPVGLVAEASYDLVEQPVACGDRVILCSDGVLECFNGREEQFGTKRLTRLLERHRDWPLRDALDALREALRTWVGGNEFEDDVSVVAIEFE